jgi:hypothetical protein
MWKQGVAVAAVAGAAWLLIEGDCSKSRLYSAFQDQASLQLKSPSTAVFGPMKDAVKLFNKRGESCSIVVEGYIDSQNGFGAIVRSGVSGTSSKAGDEYVVFATVTQY